jgi:hypothetical protein
LVPIGSEKASGVILPAMSQLFSNKAQDPEKKLSGMVLEVNGDLCRQECGILKWYRSERDYTNVSLVRIPQAGQFNGDPESSVISPNTLH